MRATAGQTNIVEPRHLGVNQPAAPLQRAAHIEIGPLWARAGSLTVVALVVSWGLWQWRPCLVAVPYLDDNSVHEQMIRFAATRLAAGHSPYTSWFPYLGLGSPQFLHYQGLGATVVGAIGILVGPDAAFRWSLYLLLAGWPFAVYLSSRLLSLGTGASTAAAVLSPFLASATGIGYEPKAYIWIGWGVWTQLCASWALPFAWAFSWRAMSSRRAALPAAVCVALTVALHFETGYLALAGVVVIALFSTGAVLPRLRRTVLVLGGSLLVSGWVIVPLVVSSRWAAHNQVLANTPLENGYGAKQILAWLFSGRLYDAGRLPVVTVVLAVGIAWCAWHWRRYPMGRVALSLWAMGMLLSFGRTSFGPLTVVIPGSTDVFMRRFGMAADLAGLYLAGIGAVAVGRGVAAWAQAVLPKGRARRWRQPAVFAAVGVVSVLGLLPLLGQMDAYAARNAGAVSSQHAADRRSATQIGSLIDYVKRHGGGRVYAGMPTNWGESFTVGTVPVFKYLESEDVDEVGYTLRTASLMTDPEYHFDEANPGDYALFGIRYLIVPTGQPPPVPANPIMSAGDYHLFVIPADGYIRVVDTVGVLSANRDDVGSRSVPYLSSGLAAAAKYLTVAWAGGRAAQPTMSGRPAAGSPGSVLSTDSALPAGRASAVVQVRRRAVVVLSASYDPGWVATVDGRRVHTQMLAPALVGVPVGPGRHVVTFSYQGYGDYVWLFALAVVVLAALTLTSCLSGNVRRRLLSR